MPGEKLQGRLTTGTGRGRQFTRLSWAQQQFLEKLGIDPFPGTINLIVCDSESITVWNHVKGTRGVSIGNPNSGPNDCDARCFPVLIEGVGNAAIVLPDVADYPADQIEVIAACEVRSTLDIEDGDSLKLEIKPILC